ncbi:MAG: hydroxyethylthiazole kinase, partial [Chryseobacterium sp.]
KANAVITKGVDSSVHSFEAVDAAKTLVHKYHSLVCISGETDIILTSNQTIYLKNGHAMMTKVTGLGCTASALIAAFIGVIEDKTEAVLSAMSLIGIAGELAAQNSAGPGSLQLNIIDNLYSITEEEFIAHLNLAD